MQIGSAGLIAANFRITSRNVHVATTIVQVAPEDPTRIAILFCTQGTDQAAVGIDPAMGGSTSAPGGPAFSQSAKNVFIDFRTFPGLPGRAWYGLSPFGTMNDMTIIEIFENPTSCFPTSKEFEPPPSAALGGGTVSVRNGA